VHLNANPTQGEILHHQYREKKETLKQTSKTGILARYGGEEYLEKVPKELLHGQTEDYVEYSRTGQVIKGKERAKARSKYEEDVYLSNHTSVWGSFYSPASGQWGFACCHSTISGSYCTGTAGIEASQASSAQNLLKQSLAQSTNPSSTSSGPPRGSQQISLQTDRERAREEKAAAENAAAAEAHQEQTFSKKRLGEGDLQLDQKRLNAALKEEKKRKGGDGDGDEEDWQRDKRRKYNSFAGNGSTEVTEEELEAYRMARVGNSEDPMANYRDEES